MNIDISVEVDVDTDWYFRGSLREGASRGEGYLRHLGERRGALGHTRES